MLWRVVVHYDDPRGGTWYGPVESLADAQARLEVEVARVHGKVMLQEVITAQLDVKDPDDNFKI